MLIWLLKLLRFKFLSWLFGHVEKRLDKKDKVNFKIYDVTTIHRMWWRNYSQRLFLKNQNWAYVWISCLNFYTVCFYSMPSWGVLKYIETKLLATCF